MRVRSIEANSPAVAACRKPAACVLAALLLLAPAGDGSAQNAAAGAPEGDAGATRSGEGGDGGRDEAAERGRGAGADIWPRTSTTEEFVVSNAQFVLMHELAHLVIDEKRVPILGPEESAADYIAAMMLIRPKATPPSGPDALLEVAVNTADGFALAWRRRRSLGADVAYWDSHSLTVQRFSTLACLLYGSDPQRFAGLPERVGMPAARARGCVGEYEKAVHAIDWLFDTYAREADDPPGAPIDIRFEAPPTRTSERMLEAIREQGFIERTFARFGEFVALEQPATFVMRSCGRPQAMWLPDSRELEFCYELLDAYAVMSFDRDADGRDDAAGLTVP